MKFELKLFNSSIKHIKGNEKDLVEKDIDINIVKEEEFAFQVMISSSDQFFCQLGKTNDIHWRGLNDKIRIEIESEFEDYFKVNFVGYIKDDDKNDVGDAILNNKSMYISAPQMLWVEGKVPHDFKGEKISININAYFSSGYERETLMSSKTIDINVIDYTLKSIKESDFFLDLWQHPCNWARAYDVEYFSNEHFSVIDNFIEELSKLGQRVIDLVVSDYPWAGQRCYKIEENNSNLFEMNIVKVSKDKDGKINCDFTHVDRYIDICFKHGITDEINLFGLIGNWDAFDFKTPLKDYKDAMRIIYYDESEKVFDYIKEKDDFKDYLKLLFNHLVEKNLWNKVKIICDEPDNIEVFKENVAFIEDAIPNQKIEYKCAIHHQEFFEKYDGNISGLSLNTCELINNKDKLDKIKEKLRSKNGKFTWFSCCFPEDLNIFLKSSLIESRIKGWFTYYFDLDGFLRWAYGVWSKNIFEDASYKREKWAAGDMFLVYPGKNMKVINSIRLKNLIFGIQDYIILRELENVSTREDIVSKITDLLGDKNDMEYVMQRSIKVNYSLNYEDYNDLKVKLIKEYLTRG